MTQEQYQLVDGFVRDLYRIRHLNFGHVYDFLRARGTSSDPQDVATYMERLSTMQRGAAKGDERELGVFEGRFTMDLDAAVRGAAGTTPGQWVVELLNAFWDAVNALLRANIPSVIGEDGKEIVAAAVETGPRLNWTDRLDAEYRGAVEHIDRDIRRLRGLLMVWQNSGGAPPEVCTFDDARRVITYHGQDHDLSEHPRTYLLFQAIYRRTYEGRQACVTEDQLKAMIPGHPDTAINFLRELSEERLGPTLVGLIRSRQGFGRWFSVPAGN